jgi:hypothetical protein
VSASELHAITLDEEVFPLLVRYARSFMQIFLLGGA